MGGCHGRGDTFGPSRGRQCRRAPPAAAANCPSESKYSRCWLAMDRESCVSTQLWHALCWGRVAGVGSRVWECMVRCSTGATQGRRPSCWLEHAARTTTLAGALSLSAAMMVSSAVALTKGGARHPFYCTRGDPIALWGGNRIWNNLKMMSCSYVPMYTDIVKGPDSGQRFVAWDQSRPGSESLT